MYFFVVFSYANLIQWNLQTRDKQQTNIVLNIPLEQHAQVYIFYLSPEVPLYALFAGK